MHTSALVLHADRLPSLGFGYRRGAHDAEMRQERTERREPTTPVRPLMTAAERALLDEERARFQRRQVGLRPRRRACL